MSDRPVVALDISVLLGPAGLDVGQGDALLLSPGHQRRTDIFGAIVDHDRQRLAAPFDDLVEGPDDPLGWQSEIDLDARAFAVEVVQHIQKPELSPVGQAISHEVHRPDHVRGVRNRQFLWRLPLQSSPWLDPQVQLQLAVDPMDPLVVPDMPPHIPKVQETQAETLGLVNIGQPDQHVGDHLVLVVALRAVAETSLTDPKRPAGQRDADPLHRHRLLGQLPALSWPRHFFPSASRSRSACMLRSANIRFSRRFSSSSAFIWLIMAASMPPGFARHLQNVALLIPCSRHSSGTGSTPSA